MAESEMTGSDDAADAAFEALYELFSSDKGRGHAHRSCPIDGPSELDLAWECAMEELFGPDIEYRAWVEYLRREGLISARERR